MQKRGTIAIPVEQLGGYLGLPDDVAIRGVTVDVDRDLVIVHVTGDRFPSVPAGVEGPRADLDELRLNARTEVG